MKSFLFIFLAGVVTGMLIAPERGTETRRKLRKYYDDAQDGFNKLAGKAKGKAEDLAGGTDTRVAPSM